MGSRRVRWDQLMNENKGNIDCEILPITTEEYKVLAKRPKYSVLDTKKIQRDYNMAIPFWKDSLKECIEKLNY
jgi:dTDP-4-dehydrorhamnose reductase